MKALVISDIHANLEALRAILSEARGWDEIIVLGDLVDYGPWPGEVIDEARSLEARVVRGNHDHAVGYGVDCRCGEETHWLSTWFRENITLKLLSPRDKEWLSRLPLKLDLDLDGLRATVVHGSPSDPLYGYLYPWLGKDKICKALRGRKPVRLTGRESSEWSPECPRGLYLVGHTHLQFKLTLQGARIVNPGSVGQPRDGEPSAAYAILDTEKNAVELARVEYDIGKVVKALEALGVPEPYMGALKHMLFKAETPPPEMARQARSLG